MKNNHIIALCLLTLAPVISLYGMEKPAPSVTKKVYFQADICPICLESLHAIPTDNLRISTCCNKFICTKDIHELTTFAGSTNNVRCPLCRALPMKTEKFTLLPSPLEGLPTHIKEKIVPYLLVAPNASIKNILSLASVDKTWRTFINNPRILLDIIELAAKKQSTKEPLDIANYFKNMPGMNSTLIKVWQMYQQERNNISNGLLKKVINQSASNEIQELLQKQGASPNARLSSKGTMSANGMTALMNAALHGKYDIVHLLLNEGADLNLQDKNGQMALIYAANGGHVKIIDLLLQHGARINQQDRFGFTPLMRAICSNRPDVVQFLLNKKVCADVKAFATAPGIPGESALDLARVMKNQKIIAMLEEYLHIQKIDPKNTQQSQDGYGCIIS